MSNTQTDDNEGLTHRAPESEVDEEQQETIQSSEGEQPVTEYEAAESGQQAPTLPQPEQPAMSPEQTLLLQVLRRAKRQQDLIMQVQKSLKALSSIEKQVTRTTDQIKQLQSAAKETQKQVLQAQRQIASVEKRVQKVASRKVAAPKSTASRSSKSKKKGSSKKR